MTFAHPAMLWALSGLAIPVAIHLLSRKEGRVIRIGSLRHLTDTDSSQFKSIRLNEVWLLLIRCLLIAAVVMMLAGLQVPAASSGNRIAWLEAGMNTATPASSWIDSLQADGYEIRYLPSPTDYRKLTATLASTPGTHLVISYNYLAGFHGAQEPLPNNVQWMTLPPADQSQTMTLMQTADTAWVRQVSAQASQTSITTRITQPTRDSVVLKKPMVIVVRYDAAQEQEASILLAALRALHQLYPALLTINAAATQPDWRFDLRTTPADDTTAGNRVHYKPAIEQPMFYPAGPHTWHIARPLDESTARTENLPVKLLALLTTAHTPALPDQRTVPQEAAWTVQTAGVSESSVVYEPIALPLVILVVLLCIAERILAYQRRQ